MRYYPYIILLRRPFHWAIATTVISLSTVKFKFGHRQIFCCVNCELGMSSELDLKSLWKELDAYEEEMKKETKSLQEVWLKIAQIKTKNESDLTE